MIKIKTTTRRVVRLAVAVGALALIPACGGSSESLRKAQSSDYDADFAQVFETVSKVVRANYPNGQDNAQQGVIKTAWHVVSGVREEAPPNPGYSPAQQDRRFGSADPTDPIEKRHIQATRNAKARENQQGKNFFVRFDIFVEGKRPFRVRVVGEASEWVQGLSPRPLTGDERPYWVGKREDALKVAIYESLSDFAVPRADAPGNARFQQ